MRRVAVFLVSLILVAACAGSEGLAEVRERREAATEERQQRPTATLPPTTTEMVFTQQDIIDLTTSNLRCYKSGGGTGLYHDAVIEFDFLMPSDYPDDVYVEVRLLDSGGRQADWTNEIIRGPFRAFETVPVSITTFTDVRWSTCEISELR